MPKPSTAVSLVDSTGELITPTNPCPVTVGGATVAVNIENASIEVNLEAVPDSVGEAADSVIIGGTTDGAWPGTGPNITAKPVSIGQTTSSKSVSVVVASDSVTPISIDGSNADAFSRVRISAPESIFDAQYTYSLAPLLYEPITSGSGASVTHDATNRQALMTFASTPTGGKAIQQTFEHFRYQPGKSMLAYITFIMGATVANCTKFAGYSDGTEGIEFQLTGSGPQFAILTAGTHGNEIVAQANWNLDKMDGTGSSGVNLRWDRGQILILDFQALYLGRVRIGFDINGKIIYAHEFNHANDPASAGAYPYFKTANLPIRVGMTCSGTVTTTMYHTCASLISEGGQQETVGYRFSASAALTAGNGADTHAISLRPKTTFNSIVNRSKIVFEDVDILVTGNSPVFWKLVLGQALTSASASDANTAYSGVEVLTGGTLSGTAGIVIDSGYVAASNQAKGEQSSSVPMRYPITLDAAGNQRLMGTVTLLVQGLGAASACNVSVCWKEIR